MRTFIRLAVFSAILVGWTLSSNVAANAQGAPVASFGADYNFVRSNGPPGGCGCFDMNGGNGWLSLNLTEHIAAVAEVSSQHASNILATGADLTLTSYLFGPRYAFDASGRIHPFTQLLFGGAHASGVFAQSLSGGASSADAFAMVAGGGVDIDLSRHVGLRAFEADYYFTHFANGVNDHQNNLRISAGVVFRFGSKR